MTDVKRGKGRPKGSEKDDSLVLAATADAILENPSLKPTTAMRRNNRHATDAEIRRWQSKWHERKILLLDEAKLRAEVRNRRSAASGGGISPGKNLLDELSKVGLFGNSLGLDARTTKILQEALGESHATRTMREMLKNKDLLKLQAQLNDPIQKMVREHADLLKYLNIGRF